MIAHIVCTDKNNIIGIRSEGEYSMPWGRIPSDLKRFRELTEGGVVIMGSNTIKSIGKPLPNRVNIVVSGTLTVKGAYTTDSLSDAMDLAKTFDKDIFIIGGAQIYEQTAHIVDTVYLTVVERPYELELKEGYFNLIRYNTSHLGDFERVREESLEPGVVFKTLRRSSQEARRDPSSTLVGSLYQSALNALKTHLRASHD